MIIFEDRKYSNPTQQLMKESLSVAEHNFGMLDRFTREKPNANITYQSIIMSKTNKTSEW